MAERETPIDRIIAFFGKATEDIVDFLASFTKPFVEAVPAFKDLSENEKKALAYALVGDVIVSPIPSPFDTPLDVVIQNRIQQYLPDIAKYRQMATRIAEALPIVELLPTYTLTVIATIAEKKPIRRVGTV